MRLGLLSDTHLPGLIRSLDELGPEPANFFATNWLDVNRLVPLHWTVDLWVGCILAALIAGWLYKE